MLVIKGKYKNESPYIQDVRGRIVELAMNFSLRKPLLYFFSFGEKSINSIKLLNCRVLFLNLRLFLKLQNALLLQYYHF